MASSKRTGSGKSTRRSTSSQDPSAPQPTGSKAPAKRGPVVAGPKARQAVNTPATANGPEQDGIPEAQPTVVMRVSHDEIAQRAYEIWLERGRPVDQSHDHWCLAEGELRHRRQ